MDWPHILASPVVGFILYGIILYGIVLYFLVFVPVIKIIPASAEAPGGACSYWHGRLAYGFSPIRDGRRSTGPKTKWPVLYLRVAYSGQYRVLAPFENHPLG
jgi:hypothetical protein